MTLLEIKRIGHITVVSLARDVINALNLELVQELSAAFDEARRDEEVRGLVLTSANDKFFSIGFDLPGLLPLEPDGFRVFYQAFNRMCVELYTLPKPTVAAVTGHATGGGCIIALCCDYRFMADGRCLMGLPEIKLGVPVPYPSDCVLRELVGQRIARDMMDQGDLYEPERLLQWGVVDRVLPAPQVRETAVGWARQLARAPCGCFATIKRNRTEPVAAEIAAGLADREECFVDCWFSDDTRPHLEEARKRFARG